MTSDLDRPFSRLMDQRTFIQWPLLSGHAVIGGTRPLLGEFLMLFKKRFGALIAAGISDSPSLTRIPGKRRLATLLVLALCALIIPSAPPAAAALLIPSPWTRTGSRRTTSSTTMPCSLT